MKLSGDTLTEADVCKIVNTLLHAYDKAASIHDDMEEGEIDPHEAADALNAMFDTLKAELDDERDGLQNPLSEILAGMSARGGTFVTYLASCTRHADPENLAKILATWPEVFARYDAIATLEAAKSKEVKP